jgi:hypothetical protein
VLISGFAIYPVSHSNYGTHPLIAVMINLAIGSAHLRISLRIQQKSALSASAGLAVGLSLAIAEHVRLLPRRLRLAGFCPRSEAPIPCGRLALATCRAVGASCSAEVRGARDKAISATRSAIMRHTVDSRQFFLAIRVCTYQIVLDVTRNGDIIQSSTYLRRQ